GGGGGGGKKANPFAAEGNPLPPLNSVGDPYLPAIWSPDEFRLSFMGEMKKSQARGIWVEGERRIFVFREISRYGSKPWTIGAHFGPEIARGDVVRLLLSAAAGLGVLCVAILCAIWLARTTTRPVRRLADAAGQVREGHLDGLAPLQSTRLRELNEATTSFNSMVEGLRERDLIRGLFGTYVPEAVATAIVEEHGTLAPQSAHATVLFSDLAGFTTMSERLQPQEIVDVLNGYFSTVVEIIERHGGVITQFQGDAVLAIFNVPVADANHAENAVRAAIEIHRAIKGRAFAGQILSCRVGINTGDVVAGSVGAGGRLSYTVHGDAVNLAARLEQLNKEYGTGTLVSGATAERVSTIGLRRIGEVEIRGKTEKVSLFAVE
nr:adenylate/guanylate cyclase domain-containing protein [Alphaproteobacteria bacterium]